MTIDHDPGPDHAGWRRRRFLGSAGALGLSGTVSSGAMARHMAVPLAASRGSRPNFLFLLPDQLRADAVGAFGSRIVKTPAIDSLAATGVRFARAYTTTALCSPARTSMLTGLYPHAHRIIGNTHGAGAVVNEVAPGQGTWSEILAMSGYRLGYVGKWDLGTLQAGDEADRPPPAEPGGRHRWTPKDYGFQDAESAFKPYRLAQLKRASPLKLKLALEQSGVSDKGPVPFYATADVKPEDTPEADLTDKAIHLLREYAALARMGTPFALCASWAQPHFPNFVPEPYASMYDPASIPPWPSFNDSYVDKPSTNAKLRDLWGVTGVEWAEWSRIVAHYYGSISHIDAQIGRLLKELDQLGLADNTVVVFAADHGDMTGAHGLFNKGGVPYEEIYRVPLVIRLPGGTRPIARNELVSNMDLMPTLIELAGASLPKHLHAKSLVPLLSDDGVEWPGDLMMEFHGDIAGFRSQRILRNARYKFVYNVLDRNELYDLDDDPHELKNVFEAPAYRAVRTALAKRLVERMNDTDDGLAKSAQVALGVETM